MLFSGLGGGGEMIREKTWSKKSRETYKRNPTCLGGDMGDIDPQVSRGARGPL